MLDMCKYNMASQQNTTAQSIYSLGSEEPSITIMVSWPNIQSIQASSGSINMFEYRQLQMKKAEKPDYLQDPPKVQDRSWGNKLNVEVHVELLARLKSLCKNIK